MALVCVVYQTGIRHAIAQQHKLARVLWRRVIVGLLLVACCIGLNSQPVQAAELPTAINLDNNYHTSITSADQALLYINAQNLVDHWNNLVIRARTGDEQLKMMRESGVFADNVKLTFDFGNQKYELNGLSSPEAIEFYNSFVNGLKKYRYNVASNVEAVDFGKDSLRFNFKHWIFFNDRLSLVGDNQAVMKQDNNRYFIDSAYLRVAYFDTKHAY